MIKLIAYIFIIIGFVACGGGGSSTQQIMDTNSTLTTIDSPQKPNVTNVDLAPPLPPSI